MKRKPYEEYIAPARIFGNLYFVGTRGVSTHIIDTGDGLIMIDPGYPESLYLVINNMYKLGFSPENVKYLVHSHGHYDHIGATRAMQALCGAKTFLGEPDAKIAEGLSPLSLAEECGSVFTEFFTPDMLLRDGDIVSLGNTEILCLATPGHSEGTMSFFFDVTDGKNTYRAGMHGGAGTNTLTDAHLKKYSLSDECRAQFLRSLDRLEGEKVDIFIGNHPQNNDTEGKLNAMHSSDSNPFIDPTAFKKFINERRAAYERAVRK